MHGFMNTKKKPEPPPSLITGENMLSKLVSSLTLNRQVTFGFTSNLVLRS